ncbi:putative beta-mannosidase [Phaeomoniella chlamydospora]|uniref:Beta-mannosidase A n=1 Tax=Phaeomoniella chlamydospora TaxID=158046 RepID=A0A0G2E2A0_PHACM|nr:putative beta-mannosidase [Phaeomoniella chlamydospora]
MFQADYYSSQIQFYRRGSGLKQRTLGSLYWQLEDIWQAPTWAGIEYDGRWKALHYIAKDIYSNVIISPFYNYTTQLLDVYVTSDLWDAVTGTASATWYGWNGTVLDLPAFTDSPVTVGALNTSQIFSRNLTTLLGSQYDPTNVLLQLSVNATGSKPNSDAQQAFTHTNWFHASPLSTARLVDPGLILSHDPSSRTFTVEATSGISAWTWLDYPAGALVAFDANGFWLAKGEKKILSYEVRIDTTGGNQMNDPLSLGTPPPQCSNSTTTPWPTPIESDYVIDDFTFTTGETLASLKLHYRTLGSPNRDPKTNLTTNAVLVMHGTGGSSDQFLNPNFAGELFCSSQLLDASPSSGQYFLIIRDVLGHGRSSKPSDGLHTKFPRYRYADMVKLDHLLLTQHLGVNHLRLVMGTSMGGMHSWLWGEMYPDFMDAIMPLASLPVQISGRNRMFRKMIIDAITNDPEWKRGEYMSVTGRQPVAGLTTALYVLTFMTSIPLQWQLEAPTRDSADAFLENRIASALATTDANDLLYAVDSSYDYDPAPGRSGESARVEDVGKRDQESEEGEGGGAADLARNEGSWVAYLGRVVEG